VRKGNVNKSLPIKEQQMKQRGFTLIELIVVIVMIGIVGITVANIVMGTAVGSSISWGINGMTESRCIEGYKFIITQDSTRQILDEFGKGVRCSQELQINGQR
jgi:prepilin-type N-terminal cleavage/methylation domain-containing protein